MDDGPKLAFGNSPMKPKIYLTIIAAVALLLSGCASLVANLKDPDPGAPVPPHTPYSYDGQTPDGPAR
jgi:uncharacterized protein YceK